jgi:DNA-binding Lrp family transcriptional regulator
MDELSERQRLILEILADESDRNAESREKGIPVEVLGARAGANLSWASYDIRHLEYLGYVRMIGRTGRNSLIITQRGYRLVRPPPHAILRWITKYQTLIKVMAVIVTAIVAVVTLILKIKGII